MNHKFHCYKLLSIDDDVVQKLSNHIKTLEYKSCPDFPSDIIQVSTDIDNSIVSLVQQNLSKFIDINARPTSNIARMSPRTYLAEHSDHSTHMGNAKKHDYTFKLQIPIISNDKVFMMWKYTNEKTFVENMEVGGVYIVNNIVRHSVVNGSDDYRYNLTMRYHRISFLNPGIIS